MKDLSAILKIYGPYIIGAIVVIVLIITFIAPIKKLLTSGVDGILSLGDKQRKKEFESEIEQSVKGLGIQQSQLKKEPSYYKSLANRMYEAMQSWQPFFASHFTSADWQELQGLNATELRQIVKDFGIKEKYSWMGLHSEITGGLIDWFRSDLQGSELSKMKSIFAKTGLW